MVDELSPLVSSLTDMQSVNFNFILLVESHQANTFKFLKIQSYSSPWDKNSQLWNVVTTIWILYKYDCVYMVVFLIYF